MQYSGEKGPLKERRASHFPLLRGRRCYSPLTAGLGLELSCTCIERKKEQLGEGRRKNHCPLSGLSTAAQPSMGRDVPESLPNRWRLHGEAPHRRPEPPPGLEGRAQSPQGREVFPTWTFAPPTWPRREQARLKRPQGEAQPEVSPGHDSQLEGLAIAWLAGCFPKPLRGGESVEALMWKLPFSSKALPVRAKVQSSFSVEKLSTVSTILACGIPPFRKKAHFRKELVFVNLVFCKLGKWKGPGHVLTRELQISRKACVSEFLEHHETEKQPR